MKRFTPDQKAYIEEKIANEKERLVQKIRNDVGRNTIYGWVHRYLDDLLAKLKYESLSS